MELRLQIVLPNVVPVVDFLQRNFGQVLDDLHGVAHPVDNVKDVLEVRILRVQKHDHRTAANWQATRLLLFVKLNDFLSHGHFSVRIVQPVVVLVVNVLIVGRLMVNWRSLSLLVVVPALKLLLRVILGISHQLIQQFLLALRAKLTPPFSQILRVLQFFRALLKQLIQLVFVAVRRDVEVFGEVEMRPQSFLEDGDNPNAQVVLFLAINPFRRLNQWLHPILLHKGDRLGKGFSVGDVLEETKEVI